MYCQFCNKEFRFQSRVLKHEQSCKLNPNKPARKTANQYTKAAELGLPKPVVKQRVWTEDEKIIQRERSRSINHEYWSDPLNRAKHSILMQEIVKNNPESYSTSNVSGRVKMYETKDFHGATKVKGKWELAVATWLNDNSVPWTNRVEPYKYYWNNSWHLYFPDFLLLNNDVLIEVKGYETERDRVKWAAVNKPLFIIKKEEIKNLDQILKQAGGR